MMNELSLQWPERLFYRDLLRASRYAALADSEGFHNICFALEALGFRLLGDKGDLGRYQQLIKRLSADSVVLSEMSHHSPHIFTHFDALYDLVRRARNDAMHTGVYARHATSAAIELCLGLEEALMKGQKNSKKTVADFMVKSPITAEKWLPVAHARQLMLTYSFSFIPVKMDKWMLISEIAMVRYMHKASGKQSLANSIENASADGLDLIPAKIVSAKDEVSVLLGEIKPNEAPALWLVEDEHGYLCGVLSPFELM